MSAYCCLLGVVWCSAVQTPQQHNKFGQCSAVDSFEVCVRECVGEKSALHQIHSLPYKHRNPIFPTAPKRVIRIVFLNQIVFLERQTKMMTSNHLNVFTAAQWEELEQQALIYKYMVSGVPVPTDLILSVRRSLYNSTFSSSASLSTQSTCKFVSFYACSFTVSVYSFLIQLISSGLHKQLIR